MDLRNAEIDSLWVNNQGDIVRLVRMNKHAFVNDEMAVQWERSRKRGTSLDYYETTLLGNFLVGADTHHFSIAGPYVLTECPF